MRSTDSGSRRLLDHLDAAGPSLIEDLITELRLTRKELNALRSPLERCGAVVSRPAEATAEPPHRPGRELVRWDHLYRGPRGDQVGPVQAAGEFLVAGVRAAVLAPERELQRWFSWPWYVTGSLVDDLVARGRLRRAGDGFITT